MNSRNFAAVWVIFLATAACLVLVNVNFGFKESLLKEEIIEHTAFETGTGNICVCPACGKTGMAYCAHCGVPMEWNASRKQFICPPCSEVGTPKCPKCGISMKGLVTGIVKTPGQGTGSPVPVF